MFKNKSVLLVSGLLVMSALLMSACGAQAAPAQATAAAPTEAPKPTEAVTAATTQSAAATSADYGSGYGKATAAPSAATQQAPAAATQGTGGAAATVNLGGNSALGKFLVDAKGMTLYTFANDSMGKSACTGSCASHWPPLTVAAGVKPMDGDGVTGKLGTITRADGALQVTYNGHPLYYFASDSAAGDAKGQGLGGVWYVAAP